jgi:hypothetical protein
MITLASDKPKSSAHRPIALSIMLASFSMAACDRTPWFPVPHQRASLEGFPSRPARVIEMDDPDADHWFARDIMPRANVPWRWTGQRPAVKVRVRTDRSLTYIVDFTLPQITFQDTGPVTIAFTVNDHVLDRVRYTESGFKHFEKVVPADWVPIDEEAIVGAEIDKMWIARDGGKAYGLILTRMGLRL